MNRNFLEWALLLMIGIGAWAYFGHAMTTAWNDTSASVTAQLEKVTQ